MKSRLTLPDLAALDAQQRAVYESILSTRGNISGPFLAWMHSPTLASHAEKLGAFCRYQTVFDLVESELLILRVAARFQCLGEQQIHEPIAEKAGLTAENIARIREGQMPDLPNARQRLVWQIADELLQANRVSEATYAAGMAQFGERALVELVGIVGYYSLVAMTLNAFEMTQS